MHLKNPRKLWRIQNLPQMAQRDADKYIYPDLNQSFLIP